MTEIDVAIIETCVGYDYRILTELSSRFLFCEIGKKVFENKFRHGVCGEAYKINLWISGRLKRLVKLGLITRAELSWKKRIICYRMTLKGEEELAKYRQILHESSRRDWRTSLFAHPSSGTRLHGSTDPTEEEIQTAKHSG